VTRENCDKDLFRKAAEDVDSRKTSLENEPIRSGDMKDPR